MNHRPKTAEEEGDPAAGKEVREDTFVNRELSWLQFARRVLAMVQDGDVPLLERVKFAGILGMLHDEFFMKRMSGLKRQLRRGVQKLSIDGLRPREEFDACRDEILDQVVALGCEFSDRIRPELADAGIPILDHAELSKAQRNEMARYFERSVMPILTPLAVDAEHPFPFISNLGLNLAITLREGKRKRFIRLKVPANRNRWVELADRAGYVPLEQVISAHLDRLFPKAKKTYDVHYFRLTRGAEGENVSRDEDEEGARTEPGSIIEQVASELKARRFAGEVRLQVSAGMPDAMKEWLRTQLKVDPVDVYDTDNLLGLADLRLFDPPNNGELRFPPHRPVTHARLRELDATDPTAIFREIRRGDLLLHHPYQSFDTSVLRFIESAAVDDAVLAIKVTIYRTSSDSPIVRALLEAARRGKQVAVLVEITARFDEAPNIAWGRMLENEGVHVAYGVEKLKTHVKLALVVREEGEGIRRYVHVGTGNYHTGTARIYEDLGMLTCDPELTTEAAAVFNELTTATPYGGYRKLLVAPREMRDRFLSMIAREAEHARAGRPSGIRAKMNQLQDPGLIRALYEASRAGVPISLNVRGLCSLRPGVPGQSGTIRVFGLIGRFLEHCRVYRFENGGAPEFYLGSADWMKRNLDRRVETIARIDDPTLKAELEGILEVYEADNASAWDMRPDGTYVRRRPAEGEEPRPAQRVFSDRAQA